MGVNPLAPGLLLDLPPLMDVDPNCKPMGVRLWLPDADSVQSCIDKAAFHQSLTRHSIPTPRTWLPEEIDQVPDNTPLVVKPRRGHGAQNVHFVDRRDHPRFLSVSAEHR
ncbi:ATP-grasp domain-containing protein [Streptomyces lanatus]|uniref:ATP-grasp domain-containing protein n=1 Tax=Streptomyces lanatus TaxID=66900 RepID=A0ABV1Y5Q5_9ACTN|nr:ATP-grasp domain-containing protein [Streptomyces lanatus]GHH29416.1 hypothetical protein GCM10018780_87420 [Streptomyces lanatus]